MSQGTNFIKRELDTVPIDATGHMFDLVATNQTQVNKVISSFRSSKRRDAFQLDTMLIKTHKYIFTSPIAHLINLSLNTALSLLTGYVPLSLLFSNLETTTKPVTIDPLYAICQALLYSLYINDLPQQCHGIELQMYTNDTVVYTHAKKAELTTIVMERITQQLDQSCLSLNVDKTNFFFLNQRAAP